MQKKSAVKAFATGRLSMRHLREKLNKVIDMYSIQKVKCEIQNCRREAAIKYVDNDKKNRAFCQYHADAIGLKVDKKGHPK